MNLTRTIGATEPAQSARPIQVSLTRPGAPLAVGMAGLGSHTVAAPSAASASAKPLVWLGAYSTGGLSLPAAHPTRSQMYAPRAVWLDDTRLIVCDSGNHRVLIWNRVPQSDGQEADVVLGQPDFETEGPASGCGDQLGGLYLPTGVIVAEGKLLIADAWHHRILVWDRVPTESGVLPDQVIGQSSLAHVQPNRGMPRPTRWTLYWPYGIAYIDGKLWVADTGNRRVLGWSGIPSTDQPAQWVFGQPDGESMQENRGGTTAANSFRWPHDIAGDEHGIWIADAGNHRVVGWRPTPTKDCPAGELLGQSEMFESIEWPYAAQSEHRLRFPYAVSQSANSEVLAVADTANNRVLFWRLPIQQSRFPGARDVIGQLDFLSFGENRWQAVRHDTLCWPYGICLHGNRLAIADSGNNRVLLWDVNDIVQPIINKNEQPSGAESLTPRPPDSPTASASSTTTEEGRSECV